MNKLLTEFVGTFFLVLAIALCSHFGGSLAPLGIGLTLMVLVYMGGHVSGAHYNPAVSLAIFIRGKLPAKDMFTYMIVQVLAAGGGAAVGYLLCGEPKYPSIGAKVPLIHAALAETLFTFLLASVVLNVATSKKTAGNSFYGAAIGLTVAASAIAIGSVSGAVLNPAVGVGLCLVAGKLTHLPIYIIAPLAGGLLAALFYRLQHEGDMA
jgi:aquaporin Z